MCFVKVSMVHEVLSVLLLFVPIAFLFIAVLFVSWTLIELSCVVPSRVGLFVASTGLIRLGIVHGTCGSFVLNGARGEW